MLRKAYPTDLTDAQWEVLHPFLPVEPKRNRGRPSRAPGDLREIINGVLYLFQSGLQWKMMPHDLPPWQTVYGYYRRWTRDGTWERLNILLSSQLQQRANQQGDSLVITWISNRLKQVKTRPGKEDTQAAS